MPYGSGLRGVFVAHGRGGGEAGRARRVSGQVIPPRDGDGPRLCRSRATRPRASSSFAYLRALLRSRNPAHQEIRSTVQGFDSSSRRSRNAFSWSSPAPPAPPHTKAAGAGVPGAAPAAPARRGCATIPVRGSGPAPRPRRAAGGSRHRSRGSSGSASGRNRHSAGRSVRTRPPRVTRVGPPGRTDDKSDAGTGVSSVHPCSRERALSRARSSSSPAFSRAADAAVADADARWPATPVRPRRWRRSRRSRRPARPSPPRTR